MYVKGLQRAETQKIIVQINEINFKEKAARNFFFIKFREWPKQKFSMVAFRVFITIPELLLQKENSTNMLSVNMS